MRVHAELEALVLEVDGNRCSVFVDGRRCPVADGIEAHYLVPPAKGGRPIIENALGICPGHLQGLAGAARRLHAHEVLGA